MDDTKFQPSVLTTADVCTSAPDCVKLLDDKGHVLFFNEDGLKVMEIDSLDDVQGLFWPSLWPEESRAAVAASLETVKTKGVASFEAFCPTAKGTPKYWNVTLAVVPGAEPRYVVVSRDVTEERAFEAEQLFQFDRLRAIAGSNPDVMWDLDVVHDAIWFSEGAQTLLGYAAGEMGPGRSWSQDNIHPEDRARVVAGIDAALADGSTEWQDEFRFRTASGKYLDVLDRGAIIRDLDGKPIRFVGVMQDITSRNATAAMHKLVAGELAHRANNIIAVVAGLFQQTLRRSSDLKELGQAFGGRLTALAAANSAILRGAGSGAELHALMRAQLSAYLATGRLLLRGPDVTVPGEIAQALALTVNELATNALKYGALSNSAGVVTLSWTLEDAAAARTLTLNWAESGGPMVRPPERMGLGSTLIERGIPRAVVTRDFAAAGFNCSIKVPLP